MSEKKKASYLFPAILIGGVIALLAAYAAFVKFAPKPTAPVAPTATEAPAPTATITTPTAPSMAEEAHVVPTKVLTGPAPEPSIPVTKSNDPKVEEMMAVEKLGVDTAPIKVIEYSSLTCGHCAAFHQNDFPRIKTDYIDTGKVQFIFKEFPLNKPAIDASKLLRCLPRDRYANFMAMLFSEQEKWAYKEDYLTPLKQNAKLAGLSDDEVNACLNNKELEDRIIGDMKLGGDKYKIQATPSFIINDGLKTLVGHQPYGFFKETFDTLLNGPTANGTSGATPSVPAGTPQGFVTPATAPETAAPAAPAAAAPAATTPASPAPAMPNLAPAPAPEAAAPVAPAAAPVAPAAAPVAPTTETAPATK